MTHEQSFDAAEEPHLEGDQKGAGTAIVIASFVLFAGIGLTLSDRIDASDDPSPVALRVQLHTDSFEGGASLPSDVLSEVDRITVRAWRRGIRAAKRAWL